MSDRELKELADFADRSIWAEERDTSLKFPRDRYQPDDVVLAVIEGMLDGADDTHFDPQKGTFAGWVRGAIKFKVKNLIRLKSSTTELVRDGEDEGYDQDNEWSLPEPTSLEAQHILEEKAGATWLVLDNLIKGDDELIKLVEALQNGFDLEKSKELAVELHWEIKTVSNAKKRFLRILRKSGEDFRSIL